MNVSERALRAMMKAAHQAAKAQVQAEQKARDELVTARRMSVREVELRGHNLTIQEDESPELLLVGAAGTGKTLGILHKINRLCWMYPGARWLIVRKVRADLAQTTLVTFERDILGLDNPICAGMQRDNRRSYKYPNGSEIVVGGMDRPGAILSSEYDGIYAAEAVQFELNDWETFIMRLRSNAMPFQQLIADTNPDRPDHWLKQRADAGILKMLNTYHEDNPAYWDAAEKKWTKRGQDYVLGKLERLTGVRRLRFRDGKWVIAEGAVYNDWNEDIHLREAFEIPKEWKRFRSIDFGYNNPFVCQWWAQDGDGNLYLYREIYKTRRLVEDHARDIVRLSQGENIAFTVADHDAEDRATLERHGVKTIPAKKDISPGIQAVQSRLRVDEQTKKPRLFVLRGALVETDTELAESKKPTSTADEFPGYVWKDKSKKEEPVDADNHGMDCVRYAVMQVDTVQVAKGHKENPFYDD